MNDDQCKHVKEFYKEGKDFSLMSLKGIIHLIIEMDGKNYKNKATETKLPQINAFYSRLNINDINKQDSEHAKQVWSKISRV